MFPKKIGSSSIVFKIDDQKCLLITGINGILQYFQIENNYLKL